MSLNEAGIGMGSVPHFSVPAAQAFKDLLARKADAALCCISFG